MSVINTKFGILGGNMVLERTSVRDLKRYDKIGSCREDLKVILSLKLGISDVWVKFTNSTVKRFSKDDYVFRMLKY